jgi:glycosyltransferase involved in cell wall biosynthesis
VADEIVVLDSFSTDRTEAIAREFPKVRFEQHRFDGFQEQKDRAFALCRNEWVLSIDADERVDPVLREALRTLAPEDHDGFRIARLTLALGRPIRHSGWYPQRKVRLFRRSQARWAGVNPHPYLVVAGRTGVLPGDVIHHSFQDLSHMARTGDAYSSVQAMNLFHGRRRSARLLALLKPVGKFLETYVLKRGFLDGFPGFVVAVENAHSVFLRYAKLHELQRGLVARPTNLSPDYRPPSR